MSLRLGVVAALALLAGSGAPLRPAAPASTRLVRLGRADLEVTHGELESLADGRLGVEGPRMRAVSRLKGAPVAELRFTYLGPTREHIPLASGQPRRQVGLKLRAQDGCNLVYVMWRLAPRQGVVVSVKRNPGLRRVRDECGSGGYRNVRPQWSAPVPRLVPGTTHTLRAELQGERLRVQVDGEAVWEGDVGEEVLAFDGPVGVRSDNARLTFELLADQP